MNVNVTERYGDVDDFCRIVLPAWQNSLLPEKQTKRQRTLKRSPAEVMTLSYCTKELANSIKSLIIQ